MSFPPAAIARRLVDGAVGGFARSVGRRLEGNRLPRADHRPWPLPRDPWVMAQTWEHLLFAHWPVAPAVLRPLVPEPLDLDLFDGAAWLAVTPFTVRGLRLRGLPAVPGVSDFHEINVRTYVTAEDKPGVFFFSLDADTWAGVMGARFWYRLPYRRSSTRVVGRSGWQDFRSTRIERPLPAQFAAAYRPTGPVQRADRGSLAWWLTERYCLYTVSERGPLERAEIHHAPWPLQPAEARIRTNTMAEPLGLTLDQDAALLHYAERLPVAVWRPSPL